MTWSRTAVKKPSFSAKKSAFVSHLFEALLLLLLLLLTAIGLSPGGSGYFTCTQNMKLVINKFKSGGLHQKHVVTTLNFGNNLRICLYTQGNQEKHVSRWPVTGPSNTDF